MSRTHQTLTSLFGDIADAIRAKTGDSAEIVADDFPDAIDAISTGITPSGSISITSNGTYDVTEKASAVVNVSGGGSDLVRGTYTRIDSSETTSVLCNINDLGFTPKLFMIYVDASDYKYASYSLIFTLCSVNEEDCYRFTAYGSSAARLATLDNTQDWANSSAVNMVRLDNDTGMIKYVTTPSGSTRATLVVGRTYNWIAIK